MAIITTSTTGHWVVKAYYPNEFFYGDENSEEIQHQNLQAVDFETLAKDIQFHFRVSIHTSTPHEVVSLLAAQLSLSSYGKLYAQDWRCKPYGVRRIHYPLDFYEALRRAT